MAAVPSRLRQLALARVQGSAGSEAGTSCSSLRKVLHAAPADATLDQATALLRALEPLEQQWKNVLDSVDTCSTKLGALQEQLQTTQGSADGFLQTAQGLLRRRSALERQREAAEAFNEAHFLDSDAEALLVHATPSSVNAAFLDALRRAGRLRELCKTELVSGPNDAALAVLEHIAQLQETALGVAFQWATQVAGVVAREQSAPDQVAAFHAALPLLSARWSYFSAITRDYLSARGAFLLREFLSTAAQTGGSDPPQTVSTLLGWVHQCLVTEGDALSSMVPQAHQASSAEAAVSDGCLHLPSQLASLATPLSKSLAARLHQQMQRTAADPVSALALWDAVVFYHGQLAKALVGAGEDVPILRATDEAVAAAALQVYKASAEANRRLSEQLAPLPSDLLPPQAAVESAGALRRMLTSATVSGSGACADQRRAWPAEWCAEHRLFGVLHGREPEHSDALAPELVAFLAVPPPSSGAVDPSLMVHHAVANGTAFLLHSLHVRGSALEEPQLCMYMLNCTAAVDRALQGASASETHSPAAAWAGVLAEEVQYWCRRCASTHASSILLRTGLLQLQTTAASAAQGEAASLSADDVAAAGEAVATLAYSGDLEPGLVGVVDVLLRRRLRTAVAREVLQSYTQVYDAAVRCAGDSGTALRLAPADLAALLGIADQAAGSPGSP